MEVREFIKERIKEYIKNNDGKDLTRIFITKIEEEALALIFEDEGDSQVPRVSREDWGTIMGMKIIWESEVFRLQ